jgi:hypothetical protein
LLFSGTGFPLSRIIESLNINPTLRGKFKIVLTQMCRGENVAEALISQADVPPGFIIGFGTQPGFLSFIQDRGTPYFQELARCMQTMPNSSWQDVLEKVGKTVALKKIWYSDPKIKSGSNFNAKQEPVLYENSPRKIPLKDQGKIN